MRIDTELLCERLDRIKREVALPAFDRCEVARCDPELLGQAFLGHASPQTFGAHMGAQG